MVSVYVYKGSSFCKLINKENFNIIKSPRILIQNLECYCRLALAQILLLLLYYKILKQLWVANRK